MVFANLQHSEKEAFFSLLDEYFSSRPEILAGLSGGESSDSARSNSSAAASAVHRALASNPEATSHLVSAGLRHGVPKSSPYASAASDPEVNNAVGRVAAASLAFSARNNSPSGSQPPPPPQRAAAPPVAVKSASNLVSSRKFGDVDTSSTKSMFGSVLTSSARKNAPPPGPPPAPAAFTAKKNSFAPPPVRRAVSGSTNADAEEEEAPPPPRLPPVQRRQQQQEEEEEESGEWAEVLYDYDSGEAGDLNIKENQRVLVTERTSEDWWTGEVNGKRGLFPASYVKIL